MPPFEPVADEEDESFEAKESFLDPSVFFDEEEREMPKDAMLG